MHYFGSKVGWDGSHAPHGSLNRANPRHQPDGKSDYYVTAQFFFSLTLTITCHNPKAIAAYSVVAKVVWIVISIPRPSFAAEFPLRSA